MKVSLKWLRDYANFPVHYKELAERLTMSGNEVKYIYHSGGTWDNIVVGEIVNIAPHPNADRLKLASVNLGNEVTTVASGASNMQVGAKSPFARLGAKLIDGHTGETIVLKKAKIRGVASEGMLCSEKELGISGSHLGIMILPPDAPVGMPLNEYLGDIIFDMEVTPNRPDCLSVTGIAREVAALTGAELKLPSIEYAESTEPISNFISVDITAPDLCCRYCATLIRGVQIKDSPHWMQQRLLASGMRPINNIVDITNYVMLEYGQPLHAFDYSLIRGKRIIVRRASTGEQMETLDGTYRELDREMLLISDVMGAVAVAGIMGGASSEIKPDTNDILLEAANFNGTSIRHSASALKMRTEASLRFEKGLSPELTIPAIKQATKLMKELGGGTIAKGIVDVYPGKRETRLITLTIPYVNKLLGITLDQQRVSSVLSSLGFLCQKESEDTLRVEVPYWRTDVSLPADLAEEVARIIGYETIPTTILCAEIPRQQPQEMLNLKENIQDIMVACGFQEIICYTLTSAEKLNRVLPETGQQLKPLRLSNPMSVEQEFLRTTLRAGLLNTLSLNQKYEKDGIRLFEIDKVFIPQQSALPQEKMMLSAVMSGSRQKLSWCADRGEVDFYDTKGIVEELLSQLGARADFGEAVDETLLKGSTAEVIVGKDKIGVIGRVHPAIAAQFDLDDKTPVFMLELDIMNLLPHLPPVKQYTSTPRFPSSIRDIALIVDNNIASKQIEEIIRRQKLVSREVLFDLYTGKQIAHGKKSLAYRLYFQSAERTLTDEEVDAALNNILESLKKELNAALRT